MLPLVSWRLISSLVSRLLTVVKLLIHSLGNDYFEELYDPERPDESAPCKFEMCHMLMVTAGENGTLIEGWKQNDAHAIFFTHFARYCKLNLPNLSPSFGL